MTARGPRLDGTSKPTGAGRNGVRPAPSPADASLAAETQRLRDWAATASPGERETYYVGHFLPTRHPVVDLARALTASGDVLPTQKRRDDNRFDFFITKRRNAELKPLSAAVLRDLGREVRRGGQVADECGDLLAVLRRLANLGKPCPSNAELAELAMLKDAESVRYRLTLLQSAGRIDVSRLADDRRVITILSSGRSTAR